MFNLLCAKSPFPYGDNKDNYENIKRAKYVCPRDKANRISSEAKDLIELILNIDPELRPTMDEILEHKFFTDPSDGVPLHVIPRSLPRTILNYPLSEDYIRSLQLKARSSSPTNLRNLNQYETNSFAVENFDMPL